MSTTTSEPLTEAFVWVWPPGADEPVVAGRLQATGDLIEFNYGRSYLARADAIPLYLPELPLRQGVIQPLDGLRIAGCLNDASPDAWGQRVIMRRLLGDGGVDRDAIVLSPLTYLLHAGSDRIGALDVQPSATVYVSNAEPSATLDEVLRAADIIDQGLPLSPELDRALLHGSSVGGARPKALLDDGDRRFIAKFSSSTDAYPVVQGEFVAMELARRAGLDVAAVRLVQSLGRKVLLVERFDRVPGTPHRRALVSALTMLALDEMLARYATYAELADIIRERFTDAKATLAELFARITFNILSGNTDDHARNHAAFWDGRMLTLTPAYDICPQPRAGGEAAQAMAIGTDGFRMSQVAGCVERAGTYLLREAQAREIVDRQIEVIVSAWDDVCDQAELTKAERGLFWRRQVLNSYALEGYGRAKFS